MAIGTPQPGCCCSGVVGQCHPRADLLISAAGHLRGHHQIHQLSAFRAHRAGEVGNLGQSKAVVAVGVGISQTAAIGILVKHTWGLAAHAASVEAFHKLLGELLLQLLGVLLLGLHSQWHRSSKLGGSSGDKQMAQHSTSNIM